MAQAASAKAPRLTGRARWLRTLSNVVKKTSMMRFIKEQKRNIKYGKTLAKRFILPDSVIMRAKLQLLRKGRRVTRGLQVVHHAFWLVVRIEMTP